MAPLRILIPNRRPPMGGISRAGLMTIRELLGRAEAVIVVCSPEAIPYFRANLPATPRLILLPAPLLRWGPRRVRHVADEVIHHLFTLVVCVRYHATVCLYLWPQAVRPRFHAWLPPSVPVAVIVHDVFWHAYQQDDLHAGLEQEARRTARLAESADLLLAVSRRTFKDLASCASGRRARIKFCPLPADPQPSAAGARGPGRGAGAVFYYPASAGRHKNHLQLFQAALRLVERGRSFTVVLSGLRVDALAAERPEWDDHDAEPARRFYAEHRGVLERLFKFRGYLDASGVEDCYAESDCVVLPSVYEGFGLPLMEALSRGVPVLCSDIDPFLEQLARYGLESSARVFAAGDLEALTARMEEAILVPPARPDPAAVRERLQMWAPAGYGRRLAGLLSKTAEGR